MARRHFDEGGHPNIDLIRSELCHFSGEETYRTVNRLFELKGLDGFSGEQLEAAINYLGLFGQFVPILPRINGIYVVGSQARHLPESYLTGNHDLDLILRTTPDELFGENPMVHRNTLRELLRYFMNDPTKKLENPTGKKSVSKEFFIDIYDETMVGGLKQPNLQIHP